MSDATSATSGRRRRRKWFAAALSLVASFAVGELVARGIAGAPRGERLPLLRMQANSHRGWQMVPGELHYTYEHPVRVNRLGFRGPEVGPKQPGTRRVLALGDSLTYGQGVADDETLPHYLAEHLARLDPEERSWEVINAGHRAYDTRQELGVLREHAATLQPDVVVLFWYWNDLDERDIERTFRNLSKVHPVTFDTGTRVEGWERVRWQALQLLRRSALVMLVHDVLFIGKEERLAPEEIEAGLARLGGYLDEMLALGAEHGFELVVAIVPDPRTVAGTHYSEALDAEAAARALERGIPVVRMVEPLTRLHALTGRVPVIPYDGHYRPEANEELAETVARALVRR